MMNVKLNVQHEYITVRVTRPGESKGVNLTWSFGGEKVSCQPGVATNELLNQLVKSMRFDGHLGGYTRAVATLAAKIDSFDELHSVLVSARNYVDYHKEAYEAEEKARRRARAGLPRSIDATATLKAAMAKVSNDQLIKAAGADPKVYGPALDAATTPKTGSISGQIRDLIRAGKTDEQIVAIMGLEPKRAHYPRYYRREMEKK